MCGGGTTSSYDNSDEPYEHRSEPPPLVRTVKQLRDVPTEYVAGEYYPGNVAERYTEIPKLDVIGGCPPFGLAAVGHPQHDRFVQYAKYIPSSKYKYVPFQSLLTDDLDGVGLTQGDSIFTYAYVSKVTLMRADSCNCNGKTSMRRNTAIALIEEPGSSEQIVGIMTPRVKILRQANRLSHKQKTLKSLKGGWVCVTGILALDDNDTNNRQWKIHPVIDFEWWEETVEVEIQE